MEEKYELENWYRKNLSEYNEKISDILFCYDRSTPGKDISGRSEDTGLGYSQNVTVYGSQIKFGEMFNYNNISLVQPIFTCQNKNDAFTKSDMEKGNGALEQKIWLITAAEAVASGVGKYNPNGTANNYLYKSNRYYTGSPNYYYDTRNIFVYSISNGSLYVGHITQHEDSVAPVISLTPEYISQMVGNGTIGDEYRVE